MKADIVLTFDYEIFFGEKSGSFENCIYYPVEKIRKTMRKNNVKGIFFIDILYYIELCKYEKLSQKALLMKEQIQNLVKDGHRIELHLHPHWLNSEYIDEKWNFKYNKYRFDQLSIEERDYIFYIGITTLSNIIKEVDPDYELKGYRAGGWCIQPFENFYPYFKKYNLKYDSSIIPGISMTGEGHKFDYSEIPLKQGYRFSQHIEIEEERGEFIEYKLSQYIYTFIDRIINKITGFFVDNKQYGDGIAMEMEQNTSLITKIIDKLKSKKVVYNLEGTKNKKLFLKKISKDKSKYIVFLSHPKMMNNHGISLIEELKNNGYNFKTF